MIKKVKNMFYLLMLSIFIILTSVNYFSAEHIKKINKSRSLYTKKLIKNIYSIPLLENDTKNIIEYKNDVIFYKNKKKYHLFWDLIGK
mgnify:CR=1 FL=1